MKKLQLPYFLQHSDMQTASIALISWLLAGPRRMELTLGASSLLLQEVLAEACMSNTLWSEETGKSRDVWHTRLRLSRSSAGAAATRATNRVATVKKRMTSGV